VRRRGLLSFRGFDSQFGAELLGSEVLKPYQTLGVGPEVPEIELRTAYRDLVRVWHPDRFENDPRLRSKAERKLQEINSAYAEMRERRVQQRFRTDCYPPRAAQASTPSRPAISRSVPLSKFRGMQL
jgi:DnaJ-class molecular chaperone